MKSKGSRMSGITNLQSWSCYYRSDLPQVKRWYNKVGIEVTSQVAEQLRILGNIRKISNLGGNIP